MELEDNDKSTHINKQKAEMAKEFKNITESARAMLNGNLREKKKVFNPNSNDHLEYTLKAAYRYALGDMDIGTEEMTNMLCSALCNLIGDEAFCKFVDEL